MTRAARNALLCLVSSLVLLNVGGRWPGLLDKSTLGHPGKYTYCIAENEEESPLAPYHVEKGFRPEDSTVFVIAAEPPHSVTNHFANDPEGILDSVCSAMSTICNNNAVSAGHCAVVLCPEHAATIAAAGWTRADVQSYLFERARLPARVSRHRKRERRQRISLIENMFPPRLEELLGTLNVGRREMTAQPVIQKRVNVLWRQHRLAQLVQSGKIQRRKLRVLEQPIECIEPRGAKNRQRLASWCVAQAQGTELGACDVRVNGVDLVGH